MGSFQNPEIRTIFSIYSTTGQYKIDLVMIDNCLNIDGSSQSIQILDFIIKKGSTQTNKTRQTHN